MFLDFFYNFVHFFAFVDYHLAQINQRAEIERKERDQDFKYDKCLEELIEKEEKQLAEYADEVCGS